MHKIHIITSRQTTSQSHRVRAPTTTTTTKTQLSSARLAHTWEMSNVEKSLKYVKSQVSIIRFKTGQSASCLLRISINMHYCFIIKRAESRAELRRAMPHSAFPQSACTISPETRTHSISHVYGSLRNFGCLLAYGIRLGDFLNATLGLVHFWICWCLFGSAAVCGVCHLIAFTFSSRVYLLHKFTVAQMRMWNGCSLRFRVES